MVRDAEGAKAIAEALKGTIVTAYLPLKIGDVELLSPLGQNRYRVGLGDSVENVVQTVHNVGQVQQASHKEPCQVRRSAVEAAEDRKQAQANTPRQRTRTDVR